MKDFKSYENINQKISKEAIAKFSRHLWYLSEETVGFVYFDNEVLTLVKEKKSKRIQKI